VIWFHLFFLFSSTTAAVVAVSSSVEEVDSGMQTIEFDRRFPMHSRILICGSSNSGKSQLVNSFLRFRNEVFSGKEVEFVLYFYLIKNEGMFRSLSELVNIEFHQGVGELEDVLRLNESKFKETPTLVIIEDLQLEAYSSQAVCKLFCAYAHHLPLTAVMMTVQSPFQKSCRYTSVINRNVSHYVFSRSARLRAVLPHIGRDLFPEAPKTLLRALEEATMKGAPADDGNEFPYLICHPDAPTPFTTFYANILPGEKLKIFVFDGVGDSI
jgi:hypothetical protein